MDPHFYFTNTIPLPGHRHIDNRGAIKTQAVIQEAETPHSAEKLHGPLVAWQ